MSFLMHVLAHISHYVVFYTTLLYLFIHSSKLEFRNLVFSSHVVAYIVSFHSRSWTRKSDMIRSRYELFNACGGSCLSLCSLLYNITSPFHLLLLARVSEFGFSSSHVIAYIVSIDSSSWTPKSDIIRPRYEVFIACGGSCLSLCSVLHNITLPFHSLLSARVSEFGFFHSMS